jgi:hypothetical protein
MSKIGQELLNAPFPEMVRSLGIGIAEAQFALDRMSVKIAQMMSGFKQTASGEIVKDESLLIKLEEGGRSYSLLSLGFTPTFYQYVDTVIELKMAISMSRSSEFSFSAGGGVNGFLFSASVNASYSQKYQYSAEGSSLMRTKLVTVPAPSVFEQRLKELVRNEEISNLPPSPSN